MNSTFFFFFDDVTLFRPLFVLLAKDCNKTAVKM